MANIVMELENEFKTYIKNEKFSDTGMKCLNCKNYINSFYHSRQCMTVNMYETKIQTLDENFKNMMTYGLNGCTAGFVIYKEDDKIKIWMCHHPDKMRFKIELFKILSENKDNIIRVMVRSQGEYIKKEEDEYFREHVIDNNTYVELLDFFQCAYSVEPYIFDHDESQSFYIKYENNNLYYTDCYGEYEKINL
jgi:hypothetical protein